jgi:hypothetical protein
MKVWGFYSTREYEGVFPMRKLMVVVVALMLVSSAAFAQDAVPPVLCGDLSEADCAILTQSQTAMMSLSSAAFELQVDLNLTNIPDVPGPLAFSLVGNGAYSADAAMMSAMAGGMAAMQDPVAMMGAVVDVLRGFDFDLSMTLTMPPEVVAEMGEDVPESITLQLRLANGLGYINFDTLAPLMGEDAAAMGMAGWMGLDIASLIEALIEQNPELFAEMDMTGFDPSMYSQFSNLELVQQYVTIARIDDDSGDTATFETTVDFAQMLTSPEFQELMRQQMEMQGQTLSEEEMQQGLAMSAAMLSNSTFSSTTTINKSTGYVVNTTVTASFDFGAMLAELPAEAAAETQLPTIAFNMVLNSSQFNEVPEITEPEGATVFPYEQLLMMMSGASMPSS